MAERQLVEGFLEALRELPEVHADLDHREPAGSAGSRRHDAQIDLRVGGKSFILLIEAKKAVYPRDVRQVLWQFKEPSHGHPNGQGKKSLSLLVAESISPGAKELLRNERVGYYDSGGSLYLPAPGAYFYIDKPPPKTLAKSVRSLFSGRRAQVLHALLARHQDWFGVKELAQQVMVSPATASQVLTGLERFDWLVSRGQGPSKERHLREPAALLDAWANQLASLRPPDLRRYYVPAAKTDTLLERVGEVFDAHDAEYAISHEAAAQRYAPFLSSVSQVRTRLLIGANADAAIADLGARVVNEGANLAIIEAKSSGELLFREQVGGIWLASPVLVYLDLLRGEGRFKEMAEHLRKERIGF
ncbi:type IV toxin-antitoxin system AbiEi family antitoxin [Paralcaligenes ureilyticus]|nr:type IV toxin-antitoxin system AbiEi family antitoxin [Paralcaligenes ureilyticus]